MKPPVCEVCRKRFSPRADEAGTVRFANYEKLPKGMVGHPRGLGWFCAKHYQKAKVLEALPMSDAVKKLRRWRFFG